MAEQCGARPRGWTAILCSTVLGTLVLALVAADAHAATFAAETPAADGYGARYRFRETERCFMRRINRRRDAHGLRRLRWDKHIGYVARRHASWMARARTVEHDDALGATITHWRMLGQNTGRGRRCRKLFRAFWASAAHRANILGAWRFVGVGTRRVAGELYVQQVFEARSNPGNIYGFP